MTITKLATTETLSDGRRERSRSSRAKIVAALLELVEGGDVAPSAARVAEIAGVGLRSVFRHFDDMDMLYREMTAHIEARVGPIAFAPLVSETWKGRVFEMAARRAEVFETILPYRISANLKRFQSDYLMQDYKRMLHLETQILEAQLPPKILANEIARRGLNVILSFQTWRLLRHDQNLPVAEARAIVQDLLEKALAPLADG
jgi:AcrR family transcriptional regulator